MAFKTDNGGFAFKCNDAKLCAGATTWATRLSQLSRMKGEVRIITFSLPKMDYVRKQLQRRPYDIFILAHDKFVCRAKEIRQEFPHIRVAVHPEVHSKVLLIAPHTVWISSANFGSSDWHETTVGFHSKDAHDHYAKGIFPRLLDQSDEITVSSV